MSLGHEHHIHDHHHHHAVTVTDATSKALIAGICLNLGYVCAELIGGFFTHSLALITDAGHNFGDVITLALSLLAFRLSKLKPTRVFTYGFKKTTILAALVNAAILLIAIGILGYESVLRLRHPEPIQGGTVALIAAGGIIINSVSAFLFYRNQHELNSRGAFLHLLTDALVSFGVVVSGLIIKYTGWNWLDPAISLVVLVVILLGTWSLLTDSLRLSLDAVPREIDLNKIESVITKVKGVESVHHIHVWAMSTTENALTAHIILKRDLPIEERTKVIREVKHELIHNNIRHTTLELESDDACSELVCAEHH